jgi:hypothetical protein
MMPDPAPAAAEPATTQPATTQPATTTQPVTTITTAQPVTTAAPLPPPTPPVVVAPPTPAVPAQKGQWVDTDTYGWIWVPEGSTSVIVQEQPYVYLYTPVYGWTWYRSPWGPGAYYAGPWVYRGYAPARVWHRGGWYAPHVVVRSRFGTPVYRSGVRGGGHRGHR